jgi:hypothetical protein
MLAAAALLLAGLGLGGCDAVDRFRSIDERVNKAVPPDVEVEVARQRLMTEIGSDAGRRDAATRGFAEQLRLRGLNCLRGGAGIGVGTSAAEIAGGLVDRTCLRGHDRSVVNWIGLQRVRLALAKPPLRPVPATAPKYIASLRPLGWVDFADKAGVALVSLQTFPSELAVIDIADGSELWRAPTDNALKALALSPNGRVFISPEARAVVRVRSAETGETYAVLHGITGLHWLGSDAALVHQQAAHLVLGGPRLLDLATNRSHDIPGIDARVSEVFPAAPENGKRFLALGRNAQLLELGQAEGAPTLRVLAEVPRPGREAGVAFGSRGHGHYVDAAGGQVNLVSLADLQVQSLAVSPARVLRVQPTALADELLLSVQLPGALAPQATVIWSRSQNSLAPVELAPSPGREAPRWVWITPLRRLGLLVDNKIEVLEAPPRGPAQPVEQWLASRQDEDNARKLEAAKLEAARLESMQAAPGPAESYRRYAGGRFGRGPLLEALRAEPLTDTAAFTRLARDARIEGVGIQRLAAAAHAGEKRLAEAVALQVRAGSKPWILVLSSQEPVRWVMSVDPAARIEAVLLSGPGRSTVFGPAGVPVYQLGTAAAFDGDGPAFQQLQQDLRRVSNRTVQTFQHRREGLAFTIGQ